MRHEPEPTPVAAMTAVVPQEEHVSLRDERVLLVRNKAVAITAGRLRIIHFRHVLGRLDRFPIDIQAPAANQNHFPRQTHDPLDQGVVGRAGLDGFEYHDIPPVGRGALPQPVVRVPNRRTRERDTKSVERIANTIGVLVDKNPVAFKEGRPHRTGWYFKRLGHRPPDQHRDANRNSNALRPFHRRPRPRGHPLQQRHGLRRGRRSFGPVLRHERPSLGHPQISIRPARSARLRRRRSSALRWRGAVRKATSQTARARPMMSCRRNANQRSPFPSGPRTMYRVCGDTSTSRISPK